MPYSLLYGIFYSDNPGSNGSIGVLMLIIDLACGYFLITYECIRIRAIKKDRKPLYRLNVHFFKNRSASAKPAVRIQFYLHITP